MRSHPASDRTAVLFAETEFVEISVGPAAWAVLAVVVAALIAIDLIRHRHGDEPTVGAAAKETLFYIACGIAFGLGVLAVWGSEAFGEYLSGFVVEKALSVDNVFVWAIVFASFAIPLRLQRRVLFWGVFGALALRFIFIAAGTAIVSTFWWTLMIFGVILVWSGVKVVRHRDDEGEEGHDRAVKLLGRFIPVTDQYDGQRFTTRIDGRRWATPLLAALVVVEVTDIIFAVDSVPAVLATSRTPFIIFASNAFAILGLRSLYFCLAGARERFHYLAHALGFILVFVGVKMLVGHWVHVPTPLSLGVIAVVLLVAVVASEVRTRLDARAGA